MGKIQKESDTSFNIHAGKRLRKARIELGKTQSWVGEQIKVTFQQVQKYEKGTNGMSAATLGRLAIALNVKVTYFYEGYDIVIRRSEMVAFFISVLNFYFHHLFSYKNNELVL